MEASPAEHIKRNIMVYTYVAGKENDVHVVPTRQRGCEKRVIIIVCFNAIAALSLRYDEMRRNMLLYNTFKIRRLSKSDNVL